MKKTVYFVLALLVMSLVFVSCKKDVDENANYELLTASDLNDSWLAGTWSGTEENIFEGDKDLMLKYAPTTPETALTSYTLPINSVKLSASELKELLTTLNATWPNNGLTMVSTITIKANSSRTTLIREITQTVTDNGKSCRHIEKCTYNKN